MAKKKRIAKKEVAPPPDIEVTYRPAKVGSKIIQRPVTKINIDTGMQIY
jgi:hypothetical protein